MLLSATSEALVRLRVSDLTAAAPCGPFLFEELHDLHIRLPLARYNPCVRRLDYFNQLSICWIGTPGAKGNRCQDPQQYVDFRSCAMRARARADDALRRKGRSSAGLARAYLKPDETCFGGTGTRRRPVSLIDQRRRRPLSLFAIIGLFVASVALLCTSITTVASSALSRARMAHDRNGAELDAAPSIGSALMGSRGGRIG